MEKSSVTQRSTWQFVFCVVSMLHSSSHWALVWEQELYSERHVLSLLDCDEASGMLCRGSKFHYVYCSWRGLSTQLRQPLLQPYVLYTSGASPDETCPDRAPHLNSPRHKNVSHKKDQTTATRDNPTKQRRFTNCGITATTIYQQEESKTIGTTGAVILSSSWVSSLLEFN
jgi:hypothetical protein